MATENTKPAAGTAGIVEGKEQPTNEVYIDNVSDQDWENAVLGVVEIAGGDSERGDRARRAVHALCGQPFVSRPVWAAAAAVSWCFVAAVLSGDRDLRTRANALIKSVLALAAEAQASPGRAA